MRTTEEMTDLVIQCKNGKRWSWGMFWSAIVGEAVPHKKYYKDKTLADILYKRNRLEAKNRINCEMTKRKTCRQLVVEQDQGVVLTPKEEMIIVVKKTRMKKEVNTTRRTIRKFGNIVDSMDAPKRHRSIARQEISHYLKALDKKLQKTLKGKVSKK